MNFFMVEKPLLLHYTFLKKQAREWRRTAGVASFFLANRGDESMKIFLQYMTSKY